MSACLGSADTRGNRLLKSQAKVSNVDGTKKERIDRTGEKPADCSGSRDFFSPRHDAFDNLVRIFFKDCLTIFCPVAASRFIDAEEPDGIVRAEFLD